MDGDKNLPNDPLKSSGNEVLVSQPQRGLSKRKNRYLFVGLIVLVCILLCGCSVLIVSNFQLISERVQSLVSSQGEGAVSQDENSETINDDEEDISYDNQNWYKPIIPFLSSCIGMDVLFPAKDGMKLDSWEGLSTSGQGWIGSALDRLDNFVFVSEGVVAYQYDNSNGQTGSGNLPLGVYISCGLYNESNSGELNSELGDAFFNDIVNAMESGSSEEVTFDVSIRKGISKWGKSDVSVIKYSGGFFDPSMEFYVFMHNNLVFEIVKIGNTLNYDDASVSMRDSIFDNIRFSNLEDILNDFKVTQRDSSRRQILSSIELMLGLYSFNGGDLPILEFKKDTNTFQIKSEPEHYVELEYGFQTPDDKSSDSGTGFCFGNNEFSYIIGVDLEDEEDYFTSSNRSLINPEAFKSLGDTVNGVTCKIIK